MTTELSNRGKAVLSAAVTCLLIIVLALTAEGLIRARQYLKYGSFGNISEFKMDVATGLRTLEPGKRTADFSINSLGFRGPEIDVPKPANRLRIGFLGASTTYCAEIKDDALVWTELVRDGLETSLPGLSVDYVNGGVPGYTTESSLTNLEQRISKLEPDVIVIYHATNDLSGETRKLAEAAGIARVNLAFEQSWLSRYSLLWHLVEKNLALMNTQEAEIETLALDAESIGTVFRNNLTKLVERARQLGARQVALVTFSIHLREGMTPEQQQAAMVSARYYMPYLSADDLLAGFAQYNSTIRAVAADTGATLIDGASSIPGDPLHFVDSVHFSVAGSRQQAKRIVDGLTGSDAFRNIVAQYLPTPGGG